MFMSVRESGTVNIRYRSSVFMCRGMSCGRTRSDAPKISLRQACPLVGRAKQTALSSSRPSATAGTLAPAARLRQSILKQALEGKSVPQDTTDEPAEKLLERSARNEHQVIFRRQGTAPHAEPAA